MVRVSQWARMPLVNQKPAGKEMGQRIIAEIAPKPLIIPRMLGLDIKGIVIRSWPDGVMTGEPVNQFEIFAAMADKLLVKAPAAKTTRLIHQQATAGQGNPPPCSSHRAERIPGSLENPHQSALSPPWSDKGRGTFQRHYHQFQIVCLPAEVSRRIRLESREDRGQKK